MTRSQSSSPPPNHGPSGVSGVGHLIMIGLPHAIPGNSIPNSFCTKQMMGSMLTIVGRSGRFAEVLDLSGTTATVRWNDTGSEEELPKSELYTADDSIVSGRIDLGRCMFCGLCMEACGFTSFYMTNEYDGMSGFTREDLWFDASRTRVLPSIHQEAVDAELAKRATKEKQKREKAAAKAAAKAQEEA